jgi:hypothetical protein
MKFGARAAEYRAAPTSPSKADAADVRSLKGGVNGLMDLAGMAKPAQNLGYPKELSAGAFVRLWVGVLCVGLDGSMDRLVCRSIDSIDSIALSRGDRVCGPALWPPACLPASSIDRLFLSV